MPDSIDWKMFREKNSTPERRSAPTAVTQGGLMSEIERNEAEELATAAVEAELAAAEGDVEGHSADVEDEAGFTDINFGCNASL